MKRILWSFKTGWVFAGILTAAAMCHAAEPVVLGDFEGSDPAELRGGEVSTEQAKTGSSSVKWSEHTKSSRVSLVNGPGDWSAYNQISFWMYSAVANGANVMLTVASENPDTEGPDYYSYRMAVDWTGWKQVVVPTYGMGVSRTPLGWDKVGALTFNNSGWNIEPMTDTVLFVDDVRLEYAEPKLSNLGFEDDAVDATKLTGWVVNPVANGDTTSVKVVTDGKQGKAVEISDKSDASGLGIEQRLPAQTGKTYTLSIWKKGDPIGLYVKWLDAKNQKIEEKIETPKNQDPNVFEQFSVTFGPCPPEAKWVDIWVYSFMKSTATAVVDEVELKAAD